MEGAHREFEEMLGEEGKQRVLQQAFDLWITAEVQRRQSAGTIPEPFQLLAAQRLQWPDGRIEVRLNEEVRGVGYARATRAVEAGDAVFVSDLATLESFDLIDEELDCGHWTLLWTGKGWFIGFNFQNQRGRCLDLLAKAEQFRLSAVTAVGLGHAAVAVDTLFSACELVAKAELVGSRRVELAARTHGTIASELNRWRKMGNVEGAFVDLFNLLGQLRYRYRYDAQVSETMPVSAADLTLVEAMIDACTRRYAPASIQDGRVVKAQARLQHGVVMSAGPVSDRANQASE